MFLSFNLSNSKASFSSLCSLIWLPAHVAQISWNCSELHHHPPPLFRWIVAIFLLLLFTLHFTATAFWALHEPYSHLVSLLQSSSHLSDSNFWTLSSSLLLAWNNKTSPPCSRSLEYCFLGSAILQVIAPPCLKNNEHVELILLGTCQL